MKSKISVDVLGIKINILSDKPEEYVKSLAKHIENQVTSLTFKNRNCTKAEALLLCSLDYLDARFSLEKENVALKKELSIAAPPENGN